MGASVFDQLIGRGFVHSVTNADGVRTALEHPLTFYVGFDPTAPSLHTGHLIPVALVGYLGRAGHHPVLLAGGGTGMVGDPTGRAFTREMLGTENVSANTRSISRQVERMLKHLGADAVVVDNATWLGEIRYLDFLREVGRFFSVNELLASETYRARLESGRGLNFVEINYRLLQAYDFLHLFREYQCVVQIGGSDQWSNILAGVDLIRRIEGVEAFGLVTPLLTTSAGTKMGKTADGTIWLDPELTSPFDFYQYWLNVEDESIEQVLALLTSISMDEVRELASQQGPHLRSVKDRLAYEVTMMVHGREAADAARQSSHTLFGDGDGSVDAAPQTYVAEAEVADGLSIVDLLITTGLASSRGSARRLIIQGGAYVNDRRVDNANAILGLDDFGDGKLFLRSGKKRYHLVQIRMDN